MKRAELEALGAREVRDDWFTFWFAPGIYHGPTTETTPLETWVHETACSREQCAHEADGVSCPFHPAGCDCSYGACQDTDDVDSAACDFIDEVGELEPDDVTGQDKQDTKVLTVCGFDFDLKTGREVLDK